VPKLKSLPVIVSIIGVALCACSGGTSSPTTKASPTVDSVTQNYLAVVNGFWQDHVIATSGALQVCVGTGTGTERVNAPLCRQRGAAMLAAQEKFFGDLVDTPAPAKLANEDRTFHERLPQTIADLKAMISASEMGNKEAIQMAANAYIADMQPILEALDVISPAVQHV